MKNRIKNYCLFFIAFAVTTISHAKPLDEKALYAQGQAIIDAYTGNTDDLKRAYNIFVKIAENNPKSVYVSKHPKHLALPDSVLVLLPGRGFYPPPATLH